MYDRATLYPKMLEFFSITRKLIYDELNWGLWGFSQFPEMTRSISYLWGKKFNLLSSSCATETGTFSVGDFLSCHHTKSSMFYSLVLPIPLFLFMFPVSSNPLYYIICPMNVVFFSYRSIFFFSLNFVKHSLFVTASVHATLSVLVRNHTSVVSSDLYTDLLTVHDPLLQSKHSSMKPFLPQYTMTDVSHRIFLTLLLSWHILFLILEVHIPWDVFSVAKYLNMYWTLCQGRILFFFK